MERKTFEDSLLDPLEWMKKDKEEVERLLGPETAAMVGFDQRPPHHCYTLFEHTLRTVEGLPKGKGSQRPPDIPRTCCCISADCGTDSERSGLYRGGSRQDPVLYCASR